MQVPMRGRRARNKRTIMLTGVWGDLHVTCLEQTAQISNLGLETCLFKSSQDRSKIPSRGHQDIDLHESAVFQHWDQFNNLAMRFKPSPSKNKISNELHTGRDGNCDCICWQACNFAVSEHCDSHLGGPWQLNHNVHRNVVLVTLFASNNFFNGAVRDRLMAFPFGS